MGDGSCVLLPGGVEQYLETRRGRTPTARASLSAGSTTGTVSAASAAGTRQAKKDLARIESQLA